MASADDTWPPALKEWVAKCLGEMSDANRTEASLELKKVIGDAFSKRTLWNTDWTKMELQSLQPKQPSSLKRKLADTHTNTPMLVKSTSPIVLKKKDKKAKAAVALPPPLVAFAPHASPPPLPPPPPPPRYVPDVSAEQLAKAKRARRFQREHDIERARGSPSLGATMGARMKGLAISTPRHSRRGMYATGIDDDTAEPTYDPNVIDWDRHTIVGRSEALFKPYLRLTSEPDPNTIRPLAVLQKTLIELKIKWRKENNYAWIKDQFKSLRQDLTVQRIKNEFTVQVYEIHARMALESGDLVEYTACIATLRILYELGINGKKDEFLAYRILFLVHGKNKSDMNRLVGELTKEQMAAEAVRHALQVMRAVASSNYHALFVLFNKAPNMGAYIMDHFVVRERVSALMTMGRVYKPGIALAFLARELAFDSPDEAHLFLEEHNADLYLDSKLPMGERMFDAKVAYSTLAAEFEAKYRRIGIKGSI